MTIDEVIEKQKQDNEYNKSIGCDISYEEQITEWLEELKDYREIGTVEGYKSAIECYTEEYNLRKSNVQYNKAIDDFAERLTTYLGVEDSTKYGNKNTEQMRNSYGTLMNYEIAEAIEDVAKQLKERKNDGE